MEMTDKWYVKLWNRIKNFDAYLIVVPLCIIGFLWIFGAYTGMWPKNGNPYNSFALQAESWLQGRLDLGQNYEWLELAIFDSKYFVSFPPFPSYILLPFAVFFGVNTPDNLISVVFTVIGAIYAYKLCDSILAGKKKSLSFLMTVLVYLGCNTMYFISNGWVWFMAQNMSFTLTVMAVYYAYKACPGWSFFFWACAVGCRPFQILYLLVLIILMINAWKKKDSSFSIAGKIKTDWYKGIPCFIVALSYFILNYARFGSIFEFGHNYLPEFTREEHGQFSFTYLFGNLANMFRMPKYIPDTGRMEFFTADGIAFWLVSPLFLLFFILIIYKLIKSRDKAFMTGVVIFGIVALHIVLLCMHRTLGGWHFGNRYTCDALPVVLAGTMLCMPKGKKIMPLIYLLFIFGLMLNLVGTIITYNHW
ncbi:MAG: hypothetical protein E7267_01750 [Lachnospiraceae bacterium]|nr:hypothetical protein [Lachnospiraceae bacterium]